MEENGYEIVASFSRFKKSESNKLGYFTYTDEPPRALDLRKPSLEDLLSSTLEMKGDSSKRLALILTVFSKSLSSCKFTIFLAY